MAHLEGGKGVQPHIFMEKVAMLAHNEISGETPDAGQSSCTRKITWHINANLAFNLFDTTKEKGQHLAEADHPAQRSRADEGRAGGLGASAGPLNGRYSSTGGPIPVRPAGNSGCR